MLRIGSNIIRSNHYSKIGTTVTRKPLYCNFCGTRHEGMFPHRCTSCENVIFHSPIPVAVGILPITDRDNNQGLLLVRRSVPPFVGELCFPGGFIDWGESWEQAVAREVYEETNLDPTRDEFQLIDARSTPDNRRILIFGQSDQIRTFNDIKHFTGTNETSELVIGNKDTKLCFSIHQEIYNRIMLTE